jgi:hypothetical protein
MTYNYSQPRIGVKGGKHLSNAEARASFQLHKMGIDPSNAYYKGSFADRYRTQFKAKTDFQHSWTDLKIEFKAGTLNNQSTKQGADYGMTAARMDYNRRRISAKQFATLTQENTWSNSLYKQLIVQKRESPLNMVLTFESLPNEAEQARLNRAGLVWTTLESVSAYSLFATLANLGLAVAYTNHGYRISTIPEDQEPAKL